MPFIRESIVVTRNPDGSGYVAPLGVIEEGERLVIAPFRPSTTLRNLEAHPFAWISYTVDVRVFAGCVTQRRRDWPLARAGHGWRLAEALAHEEVEAVEVAGDEERPRFRCKVVNAVTMGAFRGFNRAQAAVVEGAILVSRLHMLPGEKVASEMAYLRIGIGKTAGVAETEAWGWIEEAVERHERRA